MKRLLANALWSVGSRLCLWSTGLIKPKFEFDAITTPTYGYVVRAEYGISPIPGEKK